jgi:basic membrane protein A
LKKILFISLAVVLALSVSLMGCEGEGEPAVLTIGAVYVGSIDDAGYNQALHDSIAVIADNIEGVEIIEAENVAEGAATTPMQLMINQGADLIFATSYGYEDEAFALSQANPDVAFEWCGGGVKNITANFGAFFGQPPDGWYLMGMAAGLMMIEDEVEDPLLGFVAAFPIGWTRTFINAFTLGAQSVYAAVVPNATAAVETKVAYTYSWADLAQQALTTNALIDQGVDVITMHVDAPTTVIGTAETRGVYSIGYQSVEAKKFAPDYWISGIGFTFGELLTGVAQDVIDGTYVGEDKSWSWEEGAMALAEWGPDVPQNVKDAVLAAKAELEADTLTVFTGPIYDTTGNIAQCHPGYPFYLSENVTMDDWMMGWADDFYVWGVEGGF